MDDRLPPDGLALPLEQALLDLRRLPALAPAEAYGADWLTR